jgi:ribosome-binding protein aMBF1 (putative translation factor)
MRAEKQEKRSGPAPGYGGRPRRTYEEQQQDRDEASERRGLARRVREGLGLSQAAFAARLRVSRAAVYKWETGQAAPSGKHLQRLQEMARELDQQNRTGDDSW